MTESWSERWEGALCTQSDPELWTPEKGGTSGYVKKICNRCPFGPGENGNNACLEYALEKRYVGSDTGIWGGTNPRARQRMLQQRELAEEAS